MLVKYQIFLMKLMELQVILSTGYPLCVEASYVRGAQVGTSVVMSDPKFGSTQPFWPKFRVISSQGLEEIFSFGSGWCQLMRKGFKFFRVKLYATVKNSGQFKSTCHCYINFQVNSRKDWKTWLVADLENVAKESCHICFRDDKNAFGVILWTLGSLEAGPRLTAQLQIFDKSKNVANNSCRVYSRTRL